METIAHQLVQMTAIVIAVGILSQVVAVAIVREGTEERFRARLGAREHDFSEARA